MRLLIALTRLTPYSSVELLRAHVMKISYSSLQWSLAMLLFAFTSIIGFIVLLSKEYGLPKLDPVFQGLSEDWATGIGRLIGCSLTSLLIYIYMRRQLYDSNTGLAAQAYNSGLHNGRITGLQHGICRILCARFGEDALKHTEMLESVLNICILEEALIYAYKCQSMDSFLCILSELESQE